MSERSFPENEPVVFTYEDYLALSDGEKQQIDREVDAMLPEELRALGEKIADFIHMVYITER